MTLFALTLFSVTALPAQAQEKKTPSAQGQQVVVHLSHFTDDLHRCFMALKIAGMMQQGGAEVTLFLDLEGVRLAERRHDLQLTWGPDAPPLIDHYNAFTAAGGKILLCPHCAKSADIGDMGLKRHAEIATPQALSQMLIEADKIMDY
jgi:predicted peroxiredoxin